MWRESSLSPVAVTFQNSWPGGTEGLRLLSKAVVQLLSHVWLFVTSWTAARQAPLSSPLSLNWLKFMPTESVIPSSHLILCHPLLLLPSVFPSIRAFSNESALCIRWPKYWSFSFSISPSNEHSGLISFRMDRFDLLAVQGTLKSLLQHHKLKASVLQCSPHYSPTLTFAPDYWKSHSVDFGGRLDWVIIWTSLPGVEKYCQETPHRCWTAWEMRDTIQDGGVLQIQFHVSDSCLLMCVQWRRHVPVKSDC